jgi:hypothetical protein
LADRGFHQAAVHLPLFRKGRPPLILEKVEIRLINKICLKSIPNISFRTEVTMDDLISQFLNDPDTRDLKQWLYRDSDIPITLGELSPEESVALADQAYSSGISKIWAVEVDEDDDYENTGKLLIQLPSDPNLRTQAVAWVKHAIQGTGFDFEDNGDDIVFIMLD